MLCVVEYTLAQTAALIFLLAQITTAPIYRHPSPYRDVIYIIYMDYIYFKTVEPFQTAEMS